MTAQNELKGTRINTCAIVWSVCISVQTDESLNGGSLGFRIDATQRGDQPVDTPLRVQVEKENDLFQRGHQHF